MKAFVSNPLFPAHKNDSPSFLCNSPKRFMAWPMPTLMLFSVSSYNFLSFVFSRDKETMPSFQATMIPESSGVFLLMVVGLFFVLFWVATGMKAVAWRIFLGGKGPGVF